jgi:hypothetical protein
MERIVMMGQLSSGQDKLFYSFNSIITCLAHTCCEASVTFLISVIYAALLH